MVGVFPSRLVSGTGVLCRLGIWLAFGPDQNLESIVPAPNGLALKSYGLYGVQWSPWDWQVSPAGWCTAFPGLAVLEEAKPFIPGF